MREHPIPRRFGTTGRTRASCSETLGRNTRKIILRFSRRLLGHPRRRLLSIGDVTRFSTHSSRSGDAMAQPPQKKPRLRSFADIAAPPALVRFSSASGHNSEQWLTPLWPIPVSAPQQIVLFAVSSPRLHERRFRGGEAEPSRAVSARFRVIARRTSRVVRSRTQVPVDATRRIPCHDR